MINQHIDAQWFRRSLLAGHLEHWLGATDTGTGFFRVGLDRQWRPSGQQSATIVSQSRMLFNLTAGYELTGDEAYLQALRRGGEFTLAHLHDERHGGWLWSCSPAGELLADYKSSYGHAFAMLGFASAYRVTQDERFAAAAMETARVVRDKLTDAIGGMKPQTSRDFGESVGQNSQNPMMHTFEALLTLHEATGSAEPLDQARRLVEFIFGRLYQPKWSCLPEMYDAQWQPLPTDRAGRVDVGHQFEWAYLLSWAAQSGLGEQYLEIGQKLLAFGLRHGYDEAEGGIHSQCDYEGAVLVPLKSWWQQAELLRALMRYAARHGREDLWPRFDQALAFVKGHFVDGEFGGWYESYEPGREEQTLKANKGSVWKVGYHVVGMHLEALRLAGQI